MKNSKPPSPALKNLLDSVAAGDLSVEQALVRMSQTETVALENATVDIGRAVRCRFGEVIYGEGKSAELIASIAKTQLTHGQSVLITRLNDANAKAIETKFERCIYHSEARTMRISIADEGVEKSPVESLPVGERPIVAVVTAGSTDSHVAAEAVQTLLWMNVAVDEIHDVGVAGPQRLLSVVPRLRQASVIVVIAGMEAALASAVGGHVACPVIAVPTSVGYGTTFGGITALLGMLCSCSSNVSVVGIDAGFKGGYVAGLIATQLEDVIRSALLDRSS